LTVSARHDAELDRLAALLRRGTFTAKQIAAELRCCKPTAYQRVHALIARGAPVTMITPAKSKQPGPRAVLYGIRDE
jgi:predicted transcriptional regulator